MNSIRIFLSDSWKFLLRPREQIAKASYQGHLSVATRTFVSVLFAYTLSRFSFQKIGLLYVFSGGSISRLLFQAVLPDSLYGILNCILLSVLYLAVVGGIFYGVSRLSSVRSDFRPSLEFAAGISFLLIFWGFLDFLSPRGIFGSILYIVFFIYLSYVSILVLFYGIKAERRISLVGGLAIGLIAYGISLYGVRNEMDGFIRPPEPEIVTPEEEMERIKDAEDTIRKLEEARRARGYKE